MPATGKKEDDLSNKDKYSKIVDDYGLCISRYTVNDRAAINDRDACGGSGICLRYGYIT
jgi:hypothetical protein